MMDNDRGIGRPTGSTPSVKKGKKHILGIGINDYRHWSKLRNAINDLDKVVEILTERYDFDAQHITLLTEEKATRRNIVNILHQFTNPSVLGEDDSLLIYFSGHGFLDDNEEGYWVPVDSEKDDIDSFIPNLTIQSKIKNMKCRHVLLISDSCFSGSLMAKGERLASDETLVADELEVKKSRWIITSGGRDETVSDGMGKNSPFAEAIISELKHNTKSQFIVDELALRVRSITRSNATQMPQVEKMFQAGDLGGRFIFYLKTLINPEVAEWEATKADDTEGAYSRYLRKYKNGQFVDEAEVALEILEKHKEQVEEDAAWNDAQKKNTLLGYHRYIRKYPNGRYANEADKCLDAIENNVETANNKKFEEDNAQKEKERLAHLERKEQEKVEENEREQRAEEQMWLDCKSKRNPSVYINNYPQGRFAAEAIHLKKTIEEENIAKQKRKRKKDIAEVNANPGYKFKNTVSYDILQLNDMLIGELKNIAERLGVKNFLKSGKQDLIYLILDAQVSKKVDFEPEMVFVKGGIFNRESQKVTLSDFSIGKYPITQAQWQALMGNNPSHFKGDDNCPVEKVSWNDCQEFIKKLNEKTGKKYRLPTEAEWEFAARGGNQSKGYEYSGSNNVDEVAWYWENSGDKKLTGDWDADKVINSNYKTHPVGTKKANELGIHDMSGNVWEWCNDWYRDYNTKDVIDPKGAKKGTYRVDRGGSWRDGAQECRVADRSVSTPTDRYNSLGFRVFLSP